MTAMENGRDPEVLRMFSDAMHMLDQAEAHRKRAALAPTVDGEYEHLEKAKALEKKARRLLTKLDVRQDQDLLARHRRSRTGAAEEHTPECPCAHRHEGDKTVRPCETATTPAAMETTAPVVYEATARETKIVQHAPPGFVSYTRGTYQTELSALRAAKKHPNAVVVHVPAGSRTKEHWIVGHVPGAAEMPGPLASVAGSAVGATVAAALAAEDSCNDCVPWVKIEVDAAAKAACQRFAEKFGPVNNAAKAYKLLHHEFDKRDQETIVVVPLDIRGNLRRPPIEVAYGQRSRVSVAVSDIMRAAHVAGAELILIAHQHPSGKANPSKADRDLTRAVDEACKKTGEITFGDHLVFGNAQVFSIRENKMHPMK